MDPPQRIAYTSWLDDDADQLMIKPLLPLRAGAQSAVFLTNDHQSADGSLAPSPVMRSILEQNPAAGTSDHTAAVHDAIDRSGLELSASAMFRSSPLTMTLE